MSTTVSLSCSIFGAPIEPFEELSCCSSTRQEDPLLSRVQPSLECTSTSRVHKHISPLECTNTSKNTGHSENTEFDPQLTKLDHSALLYITRYFLILKYKTI